MAIREQNISSESKEKIKTPELQKTSAENFARAKLQEMETEVDSVKQFGADRQTNKSTREKLDGISKQADGIMIDSAKNMLGTISAFEKALGAKPRKPSYIDKWVAEKEKMLFAEEGTEYEPIRHPRIGVEGLQEMRAEKIAGLGKIAKVMEEMEKEKEKGVKGFHKRVKDLYNALPDAFEHTPEINKQINKVLTYSKKFLSMHNRNQIRLSEEQVDEIQSIIDMLSKDKKDIKEKLTQLFEEKKAA